MDFSSTIKVEIIRLSPALAEIILRAEGPGELRGRLTGPRCPRATTIEIAYSLRPYPNSDAECAAQVLIPEPVFWEEEFPYVYGGPIELWRDGKKIGEQWFEVGLRQT